MTLRPLGDRVLIKPEKPSEQTVSGLWLAEQAKPEEVGTVVAVGWAPHPRKDEAEELAERLEREAACDIECSLLEGTTELLRALVRREPIVKTGDTVLFSWASGQEITIDDGAETYLLMRESDVLAVVED